MAGNDDKSSGFLHLDRGVGIHHEAPANTEAEPAAEATGDGKFMHIAGESPRADDDSLPEQQSEDDSKNAEELMLQRLDALGQTLAQKRAKAIEYRQSLGIEEEWIEDEEAYEGIDDQNRATEGNRYRLRKPSTTNGTSSDTPPNKSRSTVFLNITRPYTDAAAARVGDMLVPMDDRNFEILPPPIPELTEIAQAGQKPIDMPLGMAGPEAPDAQAAKQAVGAQPLGVAGTPESAPQGMPMAAQAQSTVAGVMAGQAQDPVEIAKAAIEKAKKSAEKAQMRLDDWLTACQWHAESRKIIDDSAKLGTGVLKGPFPERKKTSVFKDGQIIVQDEIKPTSKGISAWNLYPAPGCGENIHNGDSIWERDDITAHTLNEMRDGEGVINSQLNLCLTEGPKLAVVGEANRTSTPIREDTNFEVWYFHGFIGKADLEAAGCDCTSMKGAEEFDTFPVMLTMVNDRVIRAALNPLDNGKFPYDLMVWQKRIGMPWGAGIPRQIRTAQRMLNSANRSMMENTGLSAGPQIVMMRGVVEPADGLYELTARKLWYAKSDANIQEVAHAFMVVPIECRQPELMNIITFALKMAEDITGLPAIIQGQMGKAPDTLGGMTMLNNNASSVLRRIARAFDDRIIEPHITRYYDWLLQHGPNDDEKGLFIIDARGSSVLVERDIENQSIVQMANMVERPAFGVDPRKYFKELCLAKRLDPARFQYDDATWQKIQQAAQKGPADPRIAVAQLRNELEEKLAKMDASLEQQENARDRQLDMLLKEMDISATSALTADELRTKLADTAMKLRTQTRLSLATSGSPGVADGPMAPPTEPAGRARNGQAFAA